MASVIQRIIQDATINHKYCKYGKHKLIPYQVNGHILWINIIEPTTIYCEPEALDTFKQYASHPSFHAEPIPQDIAQLLYSINYYSFVISSSPPGSFKAADFGKKLTFNIAQAIANICSKNAKELHKFKELDMAMKTELYGINILNNWKINHDFNKLNATQQQQHQYALANAFHRMAVFHAETSNLGKSLLYSEKALAAVDLPRIKQFRDDTLNQIERVKKFEKLSKNIMKYTQKYTNI